MELKITSDSDFGKNERQIYKVGKFEFQTYAEAKEFVEWVSRLFRRRRELAEAAEVWAGMQEEQLGNDNPAIHDIATSLAYLSFALAGLNAVETMHLAMIRRMTSALEVAHQRQQAAGKDFAEKMERMRAARAAEAAKQEPSQKKKTGPSMGM